MFSSTHNTVREKKFYQANHDLAKPKSGRVTAATMTENGLLFMAQRARVEASRHSPVSFFRRFFSRR